MLEQSSRYEKKLYRDTQGASLQTRLKENMEGLVHHLFPGQPIRRASGSNIRVGANGAMSAVTDGPKMGAFYDFSRGESGGPLQLVQGVLGKDKEEAMEWARGFLNMPEESRLPSTCYSPARFQEKSSWVSVPPPEGMEPPSLESISPGLAKSHKETARYCYKDSEGKSLFYTLRLESTSADIKKKVLPLTYGHFSEQPGKQEWKIKGWTGDRPLYNLDLLQKHPEAKVLVVEGEKTASAAQAKLGAEGYVCVSWMGGANAVGKTDWWPLIGREVVVWPDNDTSGFKAGKEVCSELRKVGVQSLQMVDPKDLTKSFPAKWDLADPLPKGKDEQFLNTLLLLSPEKSVNVDALLVQAEMHGVPVDSDNPVHRAVANGILWRVDERLRDSLEAQYGEKPNVKTEILTEAAQIMAGREGLEKKMREGLGVSGDLATRLAHQASLFQAEHGRLPSDGSLQEWKERVRELGDLRECAVYNPLSKGRDLSKEGKEYVINRILESHLSEKRTPSARETADKNLDAVAYTAENQINAIQKHLSLELQRSNAKDHQMSLEMD